MEESGATRSSSAIKGRAFSPEEKLQSKKYNSDFAIEMKGKDVNVSYFQENGFPYPLLIKDKTGLGMRVPSENFTVSDIKRCVGSKRNVDVIDSEKQSHLVMTMKEWVRYYENKEKSANLNVTNLEFTGTKLETYVEQPEVVRLLDWVHHAWPMYSGEYHADDQHNQQQQHQQLQQNSPASSSSYPKMQRFCVMTVARSYTDFHIDMAGSSVWYHILHGRKTMWLIPPTEANFELYQKWLTSDPKPFFADLAPACQRINLETGWTIFIPSGWIHAIYTAEDSLTFAGNFLHSFSVPDQLRVFTLEAENNVHPNACSPYFNELHWYVIEGYVHAVSGIGHRLRLEDETPLEKEDEEMVESKQNLGGEDVEEQDQKKSDDKKSTESTSDQTDSPKRTPSTSKCKTKQSLLSKGSQNSCDSKPRSKTSSVNSLMKSVTVKLENCLLANDSSKGNTGSGASASEGRTSRGWIHLSSFELEGLKAIAEYLENLPSEKQGVPHDIIDPADLIKDLKTMLSSHSKDNPKLSVTGQPVWIQSTLCFVPKLKAKFKVRPVPKSSTDGNFIRRRRVRCKKCEPCTRSECGECPFCKDMKKFGGLGKMKQTCISRQCMAPILPTAAVCVICEKGDGGASSVGPGAENRGGESSSPLMECGICWKILHPSCLHQKYPDLTSEGILNEDLPNSWECPRCCELGKQGQLKPRVLKGLGFVLKQRQNVASSSDESDDNSYDQERSTESSRTSASGTSKKLSPLKRKQIGDKGLQKTRKKKFLGEEHDLEQPQPKKTALEASFLKEDRIKLKPSVSNDQNKVSVGESTSDLSGASTLHDTPTGRNLDNLEAASTGVGGRTIESHGIRNQIPQPTPFPPIIPKVSVNKFVVRPAPIPPPPKFLPLDDGSMHPLDRDIWIRILRYLASADLARCMQVSKTMNRWCYDRRLWHSIDLSWRQVRQTHLIGVVRRQPKRLDLSWTNVSHKQLLWLLNRLPHLKHLNLAGNSWPAVSSLCCCAYPYLFTLNLNWVSGVVDACIKDLFSPPIDHRPGVDPSIGHLDRCTDLRLAGSDITNASIELIVARLARLKRLDLSYCVGIEDESIETLADDKLPTQKTLKVLVLTGCSRLTPACLDHIAKIQSLEVVEVQGCAKIGESDIQEFVASRSSCLVKWQESGVELIEDGQP